MSQPSALEPFDEMLSLKVQSLSQNAETITDQVIKARKGIPSRRAEALKRLQKARLELDGLREEERDQHRERLVEKWEEGESQVGGEYFVVGVERRERERERIGDVGVVSNGSRLRIRGIHLVLSLFRCQNLILKLTSNIPYSCSFFYTFFTGPPSLERSDEVKASLKQAIADIQSLQVVSRIA